MANSALTDLLSSLGRVLRREGTRLLRREGRKAARRLMRGDQQRPAGRSARSQVDVPGDAGASPRHPGALVDHPGAVTDYPGDFTGELEISYDPHPDGEPDPGEIVWAWVPYEEDHSRGKDRPVLVVGHDEPWLLALQLTSKDHDRDDEQERRAGRLWIDIGHGEWDSRGRPSEVRINRVVRISPDAIRREGAVLDQARFERVAAAARAL